MLAKNGNYGGFTRNTRNNLNLLVKPTEIEEIISNILEENDYFDIEKCAKLKNWLEERLAVNVPDSFRPAYEKLLDYSSRAIVLKTGILVQV